MRDESVGLLIDPALVGAGAVKISWGLTMQIRRSCTTLAHFFSCLAGKPNIRGDTGLVELGTAERLGDGLELASA
ncbi:hypothetical protein ACVWZV_008874 [Bradyrhizobium sp. GM5.1]